MSDDSTKTGITKVVILCGGLGTRLSEETSRQPKPMVTIGGVPIIQHLVRYYARFGIRHFILLTGYLGSQISLWARDAALYESRVSIEGGSIISDSVVDYTTLKFDIINSGVEAETGARLTDVKHLLREGEDFFLTYGDGLSDVDLNELELFHAKHGRLVTMSIAPSQSRFGHVNIDSGARVLDFEEKPIQQDHYMNIGFFVCKREALDYISGNVAWEHTPLKNLALDEELMARRHDGFWHAMDTLKDRDSLETMWSYVDCPWRIS